MELRHGEYTLSDDIARVQFDTVHEWLTGAYWSPGVTRERVERAARNSSLLVGAYLEAEQAGYLRVVSDRTIFAWLCDVYVGENHRKKGLAKALVNFALEHPDHQHLRRWLLATRDAHEIYKTFGFELLTQPEKWMIKADSSVQAR